MVEYEARVNGGPAVPICVHFPDESRALLETLSWGTGSSIRGALDAIALRHIERLATWQSKCDSGSRPAPSPCTSSSVPLALLQAVLTSVSPI